jgi:ribosomal subunit interface protein
VRAHYPGSVRNERDERDERAKEDADMDVVLKGRGTRITEQVRASAVRKLSRLERLEPRVTRIELQVISEPNPRQGGIKRVEASLETARKTFRAKAQAADIAAAFDQIAEKLERQVRDHHTKRRTRMVASAKRLQSPEVGSPDVGSGE